MVNDDEFWENLLDEYGNLPEKVLYLTSDMADPEYPNAVNIYRELQKREGNLEEYKVRNILKELEAGDYIESREIARTRWAYQPTDLGEEYLERQDLENKK